MFSNLLGTIHSVFRKLHMILHMTTYVHVPHLDLVGVGQNVIKRTTSLVIVIVKDVEKSKNWTIKEVHKNNLTQ